MLARPIDDMRGTVEFRLHVTEVLVRRVLGEAIARARHVVAGHDPSGKMLGAESNGA